MVAAGIVSCALFSPHAQAIPISGNITFSGGVKFNKSNLDLATTATAWSHTVVTSDDGSFATTLAPLSPVTFSAPWVFVLAKSSLWTAGGFTFDLDAGALVTHQTIGGVKYLLISGTGTVSSTNPLFDPTAGIFTFSTQSPSGKGGVFSFSAAATAAVPDGGSAVALLGIALAGIEVVRRKIKAA